MSSEPNVDVRESKTENILPPVDRASLRDFINEFLKQCNIHYQGCEPPVADFVALCIAEASARGYFGGDDAVLRRTMVVGATIGATSYCHLPDEGVKLYISLYTGFLVYLDDMVLSHVDAIRQFVYRFVARQPQQFKLLDDLAALLLQMPKHFNAVACNLILMSTLDFVNSLLIQSDVLGTPMPAAATEYPMFFRRLSGLGNAYAAFIFPADVPVQSWIYALPDIAYCICTINDVLSFHKEELAGEVEDTLLWLIARNRDMTVYEALRDIASKTVEAHKRALRALASFQDAYAIYSTFSHGYHGFYVESKRYKLDDLQA